MSINFNQEIRNLDNTLSDLQSPGKTAAATKNIVTIANKIAHSILVDNSKLNSEQQRNLHEKFQIALFALENSANPEALSSIQRVIQSLSKEEAQPRQAGGPPGGPALHQSEAQQKLAGGPPGGPAISQAEAQQKLAGGPPGGPAVEPDSKDLEENKKTEEKQRASQEEFRREMEGTYQEINNHCNRLIRNIKFGIQREDNEIINDGFFQLKGLRTNIEGLQQKMEKLKSQGGIKEIYERVVDLKKRVEEITINAIKNENRIEEEESRVEYERKRKIAPPESSRPSLSQEDLDSARENIWGTTPTDPWDR